MPDSLNQIEVTTRRYIDEQPKLRDLVFNKDPLMSMLDENCLDEVEGGSTWNDNIEYDVQDGGSYSKGQDLPADQRQIEQQLRFDPKYQTVMIPFYKEDIKVLNNGPLAVVKLVEERVDSAYMQLGAQTALQLYLQGQTGNYIKVMNGMLEALSDGSAQGWDGNTYPIYGTLTRANYGGRMLSPTPYNFSGGSITLPIMENMYQSINYGSGEYECNVILTTAVGQGLIRSQYQTQQRFQNVSIAKGGFRGLEYNGAVILASRYAPGSYLMKAAPAAGSAAGTNDRVAVRYLSYTTSGGVTAYPTPAAMTNGSTYGETVWFLNARKPMIKYRISKNAPFNGSLDDNGFIPSAGNTKIVGKVLLAHNLTVLPGYHTYGYNFVTAG